MMPGSIPLARLTLPLLALTLLGGCTGDDDSDPTTHPAGLLVTADFDVTDYSAESSNLMLAIQQAGFELDTTSNMDSTSIAALIAEKEVLFLPEVSPTFDRGTEAILRRFVDDGGTLVVGPCCHMTWLNSAFGWDLGEGPPWGNRHPMRRADGARGTPFADGPPTIQANNSGNSLVVAMLPHDAVVVYEGPDGDTDASVAVITSGSGRVVYLGWDWFDAAPAGLQDGGWRKLLRLTAEF
jgi:hypothetical protein